MLGIDPIAAYAAVVATGALALEIRRWFESGARLRMRMVVPAVLIGGEQEDENKEYIALTVSNVGTIPTTITHFLLHDYGDFFSQLRRRATFSAIIPNPSRDPYQPGIPKLLNPGEEWYGTALLERGLKERAINGRLHIGVAYSHSKRSKLLRVSIPKGSEEP